MSDSPTTVVELPARYRTAMHRKVNEGLMVMWINANLARSATYDVRSSLAFYDEDGIFEIALPASVADLPNLDEILQAMFDKTAARFYTKGI